MNENTKILWLILLIFFSYSAYKNIREIKAGNEKKRDSYDDNSGIWYDQKMGLIKNLLMIFFIAIGYILINYFGFK